jgi:hypothetical protein
MGEQGTRAVEGGGRADRDAAPGGPAVGVPAGEADGGGVRAGGQGFPAAKNRPPGKTAVAYAEDHAILCCRTSCKVAAG